MNVLNYIVEHLKSETEVSVLGLGTFSKNKIAGRYDHVLESFLPPSITLSFSEALTDADAFSKFISVHENIELEEAKNEIQNFSNSVLIQLSENKKVSLEGLGTFEQIDHQIVFTPTAHTDLDDDFFGFPVYSEETSEIETHIEAIVEEEIVKHKIEEETESKEAPSVVPEIETPESNYTTDQETLVEEEVEDTASSNNSWVKWILVIVILGIAATLFFMAKPEIWNQLIQKNQETEQPTVENPTKPDTLATTIDTNTLKIDTPIAPPLVEKTTTYEVVVSAERRQDRIDKLVANYEKLGYKVKVLPGKTLKKISVGSYSTSKEALDSLEIVRIKLKNPEAYVYPLNN